MRDRPLVVDLFSGAGGFSVGFEQAGFEIAAAVEIDPIHAAVHKFNFPRSAVLARSVIGLSGTEIRERSGIGIRDVAVVIGGAPCQGFSLIGQRALDDPRNMLVREFVRIVRELKPRFFVFENVKGLTLGAHRKFLDELIAEFRAAKYTVRLPWRVLDAADFAVPQHRERLFLLGARAGETLPEYPEQRTYPAGEDAFLGLDRGPSVRDALADLPNADAFEELLVSDEVKTGAWSKPSAYALALRMDFDSDWFRGHMRAFDSELLTSSMRTTHTAITKRRFRSAAAGRVEPISRFLKLDPDGVSNTLRAGTDGTRGAFTSPRPIHYAYNRCVTVREMARLHGFPDWFRMHATKWHGARQVGNAVAPPVARAIAEQIVSAMGWKAAPAAQSMALGDVELLRLDYANAARYWGIAPQSQRRDRKSPFRKRSQREIEAERTLVAPRRYASGR